MKPIRQMLRSCFISTRMDIQILNNQYGKASVKVMKVERTSQPHKIMDMTIDIVLQGDLDIAFTEGDNSNVVPTDTMKNTIYILAKRKEFTSIEEFGKILVTHFLTQYSQISNAHVEIHSNSWNQIKTSHGPHHAAFMETNQDTRYCKVQGTSGKQITTESGIRDLTILKSSNSGFENYVMDDYTTLKPTADRIFATTLSATWTYQGDAYNSTYNKVKETLLERFAIHDSKSVQHTLYDMGKQVLLENVSITKIKLIMPNEHKLLVDLQKFGLENDNEIFIPSPEPFGIIEAELGSE